MAQRDKTTLREVGEALFGPTWQTAMAAELGIADRTLRRMLAGDSPVPDGIWCDIGALCRKRGAALDRWAERLAKGA